MPTLAPAMEDPNAMQNRQYLDGVLSAFKSLGIVQAGQALASTRRTNVTLGAGVWERVTSPSSVPTTPPFAAQSVTGMGLDTLIRTLILPEQPTIQHVQNLTIGTLDCSATSAVCFYGCRFTGPITIAAGGQVSFTGCDFGPNSFITNAGLAADVLVTGTIRRNATPHVNTTVVQELVV